MICSKCGCNNEEGAVFCEKCGEGLSNVQSVNPISQIQEMPKVDIMADIQPEVNVMADIMPQMQNNIPQYNQQPAMGNVAEELQTPKKINKAAIAIIILSVLLLAAIIALVIVLVKDNGKDSKKKEKEEVVVEEETTDGTYVFYDISNSNEIGFTVEELEAFGISTDDWYIEIDGDSFSMYAMDETVNGTIEYRGNNWDMTVDGDTITAKYDEDEKIIDLEGMLFIKED